MSVCHLAEHKQMPSTCCRHQREKGRILLQMFPSNWLTGLFPPSFSCLYLFVVLTKCLRYKDRYVRVRAYAQRQVCVHACALITKLNIPSLFNVMSLPTLRFSELRRCPLGGVTTHLRKFGQSTVKLMRLYYLIE